MSAAVVSATSVICAAGFGAPQVWATVRSRVSRVSKSSVVDRDFEPIAMGLVPETALDPDDSDLDSLGWPSGARRMLRLSAPALRELGPSMIDGWTGHGPQNAFGYVGRAWYLKEVASARM